MLEKNKALTVYVYYKIPTLEHAKFLLCAQDLSKNIRELYPNVKIDHQKRLITDADNHELWMEIYQNILSHDIEKFSSDLLLLAEQFGLPKDRKFEVFMTV